MKTAGMTVIPAPKHGDRINAFDTYYPTEMIAVGSPGYDEQEPTVTNFGYVLSGVAEIDAPDFFSGRLKKGAFFGIPGKFKVVPVSGMTILVRRLGFIGQPAMGMTEKKGRLSYIDGCSDSLLVYPPRLGDPCLNYLHFPPGIDQTQHTHPSVRFGIVSRGKGKAFRVPAAGNSGWEIDLTEGCIFLLPEQEQHSFRTTETDCEMDVIAYHPDSDWGPTDALHPMRNRTYIGNAR